MSYEQLAIGNPQGGVLLFVVYFGTYFGRDSASP